MLRRTIFVAGLALTCLAFQPAQADRGSLVQNQSSTNDDKVPLSSIVRQLKQSHGGEPASIKFRNGTYRILWRDRNGQLKRFEADARTGRTRKGK